MPMAMLRKTKSFVDGLDDLSDSHFPGNCYSDPAVKLGKLHHVDQAAPSLHRPSRAMECISWDTLGPMKLQSTSGHSFATVFTCAFSGYAWVYGHTSTADIPVLLKKLFADTAGLREKHGPILRVRRDNASVNVSKHVSDFLLQHEIRSETSNPYEPWQNGRAERMIQTLCSTARTVLLASGLPGTMWYLALQYASRIHNIQYSPSLDSSPLSCFLGTNPIFPGTSHLEWRLGFICSLNKALIPSLGHEVKHVSLSGTPAIRQGFWFGVLPEDPTLWSQALM